MIMASLPKAKPLSLWMSERNSAYYKSSSTSIYDDFLTYAQSPQGLLTRAKARAFHAWTLVHPQDKYSVLEAGVGEGAFAAGFLQELKLADEDNDSSILPLVRYTLADFSHSMLERAKKTIEKCGFAAQVDKVEWDASHPYKELNSSRKHRSDSPNTSIGSSSSFDLIRCNELLCDLPADVYCRHGDEVCTIHYGADLSPVEIPMPWENLSRFEADLIRAMPSDYRLPLNRTAKDALMFLSRHLSPEGLLDVFDYGFYRADDFAIPPDMWNLSLVREYNSQWTVDVNFLYLSASLAQAAFRTRVEPQAAYADIYRAVCSLPPVSKKTKKKGEGKKEGLDYDEEPQDGVEEDDFFYHMEIRR